MINIEQEKPTKKKSSLEKMAPFVLLVFIAFGGWFVFNNFFNSNPLGTPEETNNQSLEQAKIEELINFINSESFTKLVFTPDPSIFDEVSGVSN
ncbi:MAG: hypothetical protein WC446_00690 [Candidatus Paceibacterota bacterium]|jgi:hypothetical protein